MSTKASVAWGDDFHFYTEMFDPDSVHLFLRGAAFTAFPSSITVTIPRAVWEVIRERAATDLEAAFWTDEQLDLYCKGEADRQQRKNAAHLNECEPCRMGGECRVAFFYRHAQTEDELKEHWRAERARQRSIADQIEVYRQGMTK